MHELGVAWLLWIAVAAVPSWSNELPPTDGAVTIAAQEWPFQPGPREVRVDVRYPRGSLKNVTGRTGLMLSLHNWGGEAFVGTADPKQLADRLDVIAIGVDYLQSGRVASVDGPEPYDFGWLQALDALRALHFVFAGLRDQKIDFDARRVFATGGSGGGNVALMSNKLAPRTFACIVDLCGMPKLSDDIAFHLPGGSDLNARYSRDPLHRNFLTADEQELRFVGHPQHLEAMRKLATTCKIVVVHGTDDQTCPFQDAREMVDNMRRAQLDVVPHFVTKSRLDGKAFTSTGHALGNRTEIVFLVAESSLAPGRATSILREGLTDFERQEDIRFRTSTGHFVISYAGGPPVGRFEVAAPPRYSDRLDLRTYIDAAGEKRAIQSRDDWEIRRRQILAGMQLVMGTLPPAAQRVPLDVQVVEERTVGSVAFRKLTFQSEAGDRVPAWLLLPKTGAIGKLPAVLCLHQTVKAGKDEPAGLAGDPRLDYAFELAQRGFVTLAPDYPSFGEHTWDFTAHPQYEGGTMKAIWDNFRGVDLLQSLPEVDRDRIGVIGHSLGGHNAMFTAAFDQRLKVIVSSCGFTRFHKDDMPSWTGPSYMPRIAAKFGNDADQIPFDFPEVIASFAPRPFFCVAATRDSDFDVEGVRESMRSAEPIYRLWDRVDSLQATYPDAEHSFPDVARVTAYEFLERHLARPSR